MAGWVKHTELIARFSIVFSWLPWALFIKFSGQIIELGVRLARLATHNFVLEEKAIRTAGHSLSVPIDQAADLIKELTVAPNEVHVIDKLLHALVRWTRLPVWQ